MKKPYVRRKVTNADEETRMQMAFVKYIKLQHPSLLFSSSLAGVNLGLRLGAKMKAMGYSTGFPDIMVYTAKKHFKGLVMELKTKEGRVKPDQKKWHLALKEEGWAVCIPRSLGECIKHLEDYLKGVSPY